VTVAAVVVVVVSGRLFIFYFIRFGNVRCVRCSVFSINIYVSVYSLIWLL